MIGAPESSLLAVGISATCTVKIWSLTASSNSLASASANLSATFSSKERLDWVISISFNVTKSCAVLSITKFSLVIVKSVAVIAAPAVHPVTNDKVGKVCTVTVSPDFFNSPVNIEFVYL